MKQKLKEKYPPESYKHHLLDKLHNLHQGSSRVHDQFDDLTLRCEVQKGSYQAILDIIPG